MNKKILKLNIIIMICIVLILSGCSLKSNKTEDNQQQNEQEQNVQDNVKYTSYIVNMGSSFINLNEEGKIIISDYKQLQEILNQNNTSEQISKTLNDTLKKYDEEYFKKKSLALVSAEATAGCNIELNETVKDGDKLKVEYTIKDDREEGMMYITVMFSDLIVTEIDKDIKDIVVITNQ